MLNIMNEYIKIVKSNMNQFMKICTDNRIMKKISDSFIETYIEIRYFGLIEAKQGYTVKNKILTDLRNLKDRLIIEDNKNQKSIELAYIFIDSCIALNEKKEEQIQDDIETILKLRSEHLEKFDREYIKPLLHQAFIEANEAKDRLLEKIESKNFYLKFSNYKNSNLRKATIKYNIRFPSIYSYDAINKTFNSGNTKEDKLFIEYYMLTAQIIRDLEQGIYRRQYISEFADSLLEKTQKLARLLEIINNSSIQDRIVLSINSRCFEKSKDVIYDLISNGYKIALNIDEKFEITALNMQRLSVFEYILIEKTQKNYNEIIKFKLENLIEN